MAEGGKKKTDPTVPIVIGIGALLLVLLFGGCGNITLPTIGTGSGSGSGSGSSSGSGSGNPGTSHSRYCDSRRYDCRGHFDDSGRWIPDQGTETDRDRHHGSGHARRRPRPTDDPDPSGER